MVGSPSEVSSYGPSVSESCFGLTDKCFVCVVHVKLHY